MSRHDAYLERGILPEPDDHDDLCDCGQLPIACICDDDYDERD